MTNSALEHVFDKVRALSHEQQSAIAAVIDDFTVPQSEIQLTAAQVEEVERRLNDTTIEYVPFDDAYDRIMQRLA